MVTIYLESNFFSGSLLCCVYTVLCVFSQSKTVFRRDPEICLYSHTFSGYICIIYMNVFFFYFGYQVMVRFPPNITGKFGSANWLTIIFVHSHFCIYKCFWFYVCHTTTCKLRNIKRP